MSKSRGSRPSATIVQLLLLALVTGCAVPDLVWRRVDDLIVDRVDGWLALEPHQEQQLRERLRPWLRTVRRDRLPVYAGFVREVAARVEPDIDEADARWAESRFRELYGGLVSSFVPILTPALTTLTPSQMDHLARRCREENDSYRETYIEGRNEGRYVVAENMIEQVERWTGPLHNNQRALIHDRAGEFPDASEAWLGYRQRMQQRLLDALESDADAALLERLLRDWLVERRGRSDEGRELSERLERAIRGTLVEVGRSLTPEQRARAKRRLLARAEQMEQLAAASTSR